MLTKLSETRESINKNPGIFGVRKVDIPFVPSFPSFCSPFSLIRLFLSHFFPPFSLYGKMSENFWVGSVNVRFRKSDIL